MYPITSKVILGLGALLMALAVSAGAFGAHALRDKLDAYHIGVYEKAVFYHFVHALGLLIVGLISQQQLLAPAASSKVALLLLFGIIIFSGTLYALALTGMKWLGMITPIGGLSFIIAWLYLSLLLLKN